MGSYICTFDNGSEALVHYGVLGMRWGVRHDNQYQSDKSRIKAAYKKQKEAINKRYNPSINEAYDRTLGYKTLGNVANRSGSPGGAYLRVKGAQHQGNAIDLEIARNRAIKEARARKKAALRAARVDATERLSGRDSVSRILSRRRERIS